MTDITTENNATPKSKYKLPMVSVSGEISPQLPSCDLDSETSEELTSCNFHYTVTAFRIPDGQ